MAMKSYKSVDEHINSFSTKEKAVLNEIRKTIKKIAPNATETIAYGIPTFKLNGKTLVHFAGYKTHIGFYPSPNGIKKFEKDIKPYASGKGTARFSWDDKLPLGLIEKIVKFRVEEVEK